MISDVTQHVCATSKAKQQVLPQASIPLPLLDTFIGDMSEEKLENSFLLAFNNINGLSLTLTSLQEFVSITQDLQLDWVGLAETHLDTTTSHVREEFKSVMQSTHGFPAVNCAFAALDVDFGTDRKQGGVLQMAVNNLAT